MLRQPAGVAHRPIRQGTIRVRQIVVEQGDNGLKPSVGLDPRFGLGQSLERQRSVCLVARARAACETQMCK